MPEPCFTLRRNGRRITCAPEVPRELAERWRAEWEMAFGDDRRPVPGMPTKEDLALLETELGLVVLKRERMRGARALLRRAGLRRTRAQRAFRLGRAMVAAGVSTPTPLAFLVETGKGRGLRTGLVTRFVRGTGPWETFAASGPPDDVEAADVVLRAVADSLATLHRAGFRHRDLKAPNLLFDESVEPAPRVWILDLDGASRCPPPPPPPVTLRDLSRLCASFGSPSAAEAGVTPEHWRRFVELYLERMTGEPSDRSEVAHLVAETSRRALRKIHRNLRADRPLA